MGSKPTKYTEIGPFVERIENQIRMTKLFPYMPQTFKIQFNIEKTNGKTQSSWKQINAFYDGGVFAEYKDKDPTYTHRVLGERLDSEDLSEFKNYVLGVLKERGRRSGMNNLELMEADKPSVRF